MNTYFSQCNQIIDEIIKLRNKASVTKLSDYEKAKIDEILKIIVKGLIK